MPSQPAWISRINAITEELRAVPRPFVDRATIEHLLRLGRRRAQQILAPCVSDRVGTNGLADRDTVIAHLRSIAEGGEGQFEIRRRRKVATLLEQLRMERSTEPHLLVEAPVQVVNQQIENLPAGVGIEPGRIAVEFEAPQEALEKLLALARAIRTISKPSNTPVRNVVFWSTEILVDR